MKGSIYKISTLNGKIYYTPATLRRRGARIIHIGKMNVKIKGCPNCGKHSFSSNFKFCPWCNVKLEEMKETEFNRINVEYAKEIYGFAVE